MTKQEKLYRALVRAIFKVTDRAQRHRVLKALCNYYVSVMDTEDALRAIIQGDEDGHDTEDTQDDASVGAEAKLS